METFFPKVISKNSDAQYFIHIHSLLGTMVCLCFILLWQVTVSTEVSESAKDEAITKCSLALLPCRKAKIDLPKELNGLNLFTTYFVETNLGVNVTIVGGCKTCCWCLVIY